MNYDKCDFSVDKITYMGDVLSGDGLTVQGDGFKAFVDAPAPQDKSKIYWIGTVLQYPGGRFTKNLKITIHTWDIFILLEKHHKCHCMPTNYRYDNT